jgi:hypothetical protein
MTFLDGWIARLFGMCFDSERSGQIVYERIGEIPMLESR